jgi:hypothetical protein
MSLQWWAQPGSCYYELQFPKEGNHVNRKTLAYVL